ncbi:MAG: serine hydrolase [Candidatus Sulfotelmatobacter sp.]
MFRCLRRWNKPSETNFFIIPYRARFDEKADSGTVRNADFLDSSYKIPGGGWLSSAEDMARFEVAILNDKFIRRTTRDLMWTPHKPSDGSRDTYALGRSWGEENEQQVASVGIIGGEEGTSTAFRIVPEHRINHGILSLLCGGSRIRHRILWFGNFSRKLP